MNLEFNQYLQTLVEILNTSFSCFPIEKKAKLAKDRDEV